MKRNRVDEILNNQGIIRKIIFGYISTIVIVSVFVVSLLFVIINQNKVQYVNYNESSKIDYKVYLKENEFFENSYLEKDNQYIATLIDYITADFNYELSIEESDIDYEYTYKILAEVDVKENNTDNSLYGFKDVLVGETIESLDSNNKATINQKVSINYNEYNDRIKKFINTYELEEITSTLNINMYITAKGKCNGYETENNGDTVISLTIPLTTKTVAIDMESNLVEQENKLTLCKKNDYSSIIIIILMIILIGVDIFLISKLGKTIINSRTAESIYDRELKKILNNYRSYIQKINNEFELDGYQVLKVDTFSDMLEIRDTIQEPILMVQSEEKRGTYFLIPSKTKILYSYGLKVSDIEKKLTELEKDA